MNPDRPWDTPEAEWRADVARVRAGRRLVPPAWPGGARSALALSFDCDHETFELGAGRAAVGRLAWGEFGRRTGVPRILEVLARHDARATFFHPAVAALIDAERVMQLGPVQVSDYVTRASLYQYLDCPQAERFDLEHALLLTEDPVQRLKLSERIGKLPTANRSIH